MEKGAVKTPGTPGRKEPGMQNAKHAMQNAKPGRHASRILILNFAIPVLHFAFSPSSLAFRAPWRRR
jgi:hypothetical protein